MSDNDGLTTNERRLKEAAERMQAHNLEQQTEVRRLHREWTRMCDDLLAAGNDVEQLRGYYPEYQTPEEREHEQT